MKSNAARKHLLEHGFVKIGRTRAKDGKRFTTIYVRAELVGNYASPTDAYKDFLKCEKN